MKSLNSILIEGNLIEDPEFIKTDIGTSLCKFSIAAERFFKQEGKYQKEVSFFKVKTWARLAETCNQYLKKGRGVRIVGRLKQDQWKGNDGEDKSAVYIIADQVEFRPDFRKKENLPKE